MASLLVNYKYLTKENLDGFDKYKYSSVDTSPLSKYVMHPFWNQIVKLCPLWLSANLLTLTGWLVSFFFFLLVSYYDPNFVSVNSQSVPQWVWLVGAICIFLSHQLDGIDGKQARRTNSSSPLGELFDHGLDSSIVSLMGVGILSIFGISERTATSWEFIYIQTVVLVAFYLAHWEKYTTSVMYLPWAYDISQLWLSGSFLLTYIYGPQIWRNEWFYGYSVAEVLKVCLNVIAPAIIPISLYNQYVMRKQHPEKCVSFFEGLVPLFSLGSVMSLAFLFLYFSVGIIENHIRLFLVVYGILYSNLNCRLIIAQMTGTKCERFNILALPLIPMIVLSKLKIIRDDVMLTCYVIFLSLAHLHYGINVVRQLCDHLNIYCFSVAKKPAKVMVNGHKHSNGVSKSNGVSPKEKLALD